jgi:hypothetical protein
MFFRFYSCRLVSLFCYAFWVQLGAWAIGLLHWGIAVDETNCYDEGIRQTANELIYDGSERHLGWSYMVFASRDITIRFYLGMIS